MSQLLLLAPKLELRRESWGGALLFLGKADFILPGKADFQRA
jgi:hypothetical protein